MAYLAVNRDGEELVFNDCPIYDRGREHMENTYA